MERSPYTIGVIGSGNIGGTVGVHFARAGHRVVFSSRHPERLGGLVSEAGPDARADTVENAAAVGEVILLAIPFGLVPDTANLIGPLAGKVLLDAGNYYPGRDGDRPGREMEERGLSETEWVAHYFSGASVAKVFNTIYFKTLRDRAFESGPGRLAIPFAADDGSAREVVEALLTDIGFAAVDVGGLDRTGVMQPNRELYTLELDATALKALVHGQR